MLYSYDRREGDLAVLVDEDGNSRTLPVDALPPEAKEGDMLRQQGESFCSDAVAAAQRRQQVLSLQQRLLRRRKDSQ